MAIGLHLYLSSQSICIVGFEFPTMGGPMLGNLSTLLSSQTLLSTSQSRSPSFLEWLLFSLNVLTRLPTPSFSLDSPIYSLRWVEVLWLLPLASANGGLIPSSLGGWGGSGIGTDSHLPKTAWQRYYLRQYREAKTSFCRATTHPTKLRLIRSGSLLTFKVKWSRYVYWAHIGSQRVSGSRS